MLAAVCLVASVAGFAVAWSAWPTNAATSPLLTLSALLWSGSYLAAGVFLWRRSRLAGPALLVAVGLLLFPARFVVPSGVLFVPALLVIVLCAWLGHRYLRAARTAAR